MVSFAVDSGRQSVLATMSRQYSTEAALDPILSDDGEPESDGELDEPMCPGSDEEFDLDIDDQFSLCAKSIVLHIIMLGLPQVGSLESMQIHIHGPQWNCVDFAKGNLAYKSTFLMGTFRLLRA